VVILSTVSDNSANLWRFNMSTGDFRQLTFVKDGEGSCCTPDGKWVFFRGYVTDSVGARLQDSESRGHTHRTGPRQRILACGFTGWRVPSLRQSGWAGRASQIEAHSSKIEGGTPVQQFDTVPDNLNLDWTPDGRALVYTHIVGSARHISMQRAERRSSGPANAFRFRAFEYYRLCVFT
jgi:Tol biopolymer transport system component